VEKRKIIFPFLESNPDSLVANFIASSLQDYCLGRVNNEMEWMWKEVTVAWFELLSLCLSGGTEERKRRQSG
jgi:hypothetical protein